MKQLRIEGTALQVSRFGFGTSSLHHLSSQRARLALLQTAVDAGLTHFDTSPFYGFGLAENAIGKALKSVRDRVTIASKVGLYPQLGSASTTWGLWARKIAGKAIPRLSSPRVDWSLRAAEQSLAASLLRLKTDYLDVLFLHEPVALKTGLDDFLNWLELKRTAGVIRAWGIAGVRSAVGPLVNHPLAQIVQTKNSLDGDEAAFLQSAGRGLQFTYGYMKTSRTDAARPDIRQLVEAEIEGAILISTRKQSRIRELERILATRG